MDITADERIVELEEIRRAYIRDIVGLRANLAHYKALCEELRGAFGPLMEVLTDEGWIMRRSEIAEKYLAANAALAKSKELP